MKFIYSLSITLFIFCMWGCRQNPINSTQGVSTKKIIYANTSSISSQEDGEKEDGIKEAQEMEFEHTKDLSLGYVPKQRLIEAVQSISAARAAGNFTSNTSALTWAERGPSSDINGPFGNGRISANQSTSGRLRSMLVDLTDPTNHNVWVGAVAGGIWHTTDVSASNVVWSPVSDQFSNMAIADIAQDPSNTNTMYFATGEKSYTGDAIRGGGIFKSTDHGVTWALLPNSVTYYQACRLVCDASGNLYVGTITGTIAGVGGVSGLFRSNDGGNTFTNISPAGLSSRISELTISSTGRMHVNCGYYNNTTTTGAYRYTDNPSTVTSATWTSPVTSYTTTTLAVNCDIAVNGNTLYALPANSAYQTPKVWKSTDGGANWTVLATTFPITGNSAISSGQGYYNLGIAVSTTDANKVMIGGLNSYVTTDGGTTWSINSNWVTYSPQPSSNYVHADHQVIVWNGNEVMDGGDGGLFFSANNGSTFKDKNRGLNIKQFYSCAIHPTLTNYFLAGAQDNGSHQFTNAGLSSTTEVTGGDGAFVHIDQKDPQNQFTSYVFNQYRRSTDGGNTWGSINFSATVGSFINPTDYDNVNKTFYGGYGAGKYLAWLNANTGTSALSVTVPQFASGSITYTGVSKYTNKRVYFGLDNGKIVKVDDATGSATGADITGSSMSASTVSCIAQGTTDNNLLATYSNYGSQHVWVSTTGGGTAGWTNISGDLPDIPVRWAMFYPEDNTKAILATEAGIFETSFINGSSTQWVQNAGFPFVRTDMLKFRTSDQTIIAATHGRGIWSAIIPAINPYIRFLTPSSYDNYVEKTTGTSGCRNYTDYTIPMHIDKAPTGTATVTLSVAGGATATLGDDYDFTTNGNFTAPSSLLTFSNGATADQNIILRVYDDDEFENAPESFVFNYSVSGSTDALKAPSSQSLTIIISDNDLAPVVSTYSGSYSVGSANANLSSQSAFRGDIPKYRIQYLYTKAELNAAGITSAGFINALTLKVITKNSTLPYNGFTIAMASTASTQLNAGFTGATLQQVYTGNYSTVLGDNVFNFSSPYYWNGTSNIVINCCFDNGIITSGVDVMKGTSAPLGTAYACTFIDETLAGSACSQNASYIDIPRIDAVFSATSGNPVETAASSTKTNYVSNNGIYYFYTGNNILSRLTGASANLQCVSSLLFEAGNTWQTFYSGTRSQKVFEITPGANTAASYTVGLYFTLAELAGKDPATLIISKTNAATLGGANPSNTTTATTSFTAYGTGYLFTASFTGFSKFFLVDANVVLPVKLISFTGILNSNSNTVLSWKAENEVNLRSYEIEKSRDASIFSKTGEVAATNAGNYNFTDAEIINEARYFRLKLLDRDGKFSYSNVVKLENTKSDNSITLLGNPVTDRILLRVSGSITNKPVNAQLFNASGQQVTKWINNSATGTVQLNLPNTLSAGTYYLKVQVGELKQTIPVVKK